MGIAGNPGTRQLPVKHGSPTAMPATTCAWSTRPAEVPRTPWDRSSSNAAAIPCLPTLCSGTTRSSENPPPSSPATKPRTPASGRRRFHIYVMSRTDDIINAAGHRLDRRAERC